MALWFETALLGDHWAEGVRISAPDGVITQVEIGVPPAPGDERGGIALPGLCNAHSHAFQRGMAGLAEARGPASRAGDSFWTWREVMYRFLDRLEPDDLEAIAAQAYAEMLEAGFTRVGEFHYLHHAADGAAYDNPAEMAQRLAAAAAQTGIGLTLLPVFYAHGGFGGAPPTSGQRRFLSDPDSFARLVEASRHVMTPLPDAVVGVAPHSLRAATVEEIALIAPLASGGPIHIHIAEQAREVTDCLAFSGARPISWLVDNLDVGAGWSLVHATHTAPDELARIAGAGAVVVLCPITEANLGDGLFPAAAFLSAGGAMAIGSDSNVLIDAAEELRCLEYGQRLAGESRIVLAADDRPSVGGRLFAAAGAGGGQSLGVRGPGGMLPGARSGELAPGATLDLVALDSGHPALVGRRGDALVDGWIFAARRGVVESVWRRGRKVVAEGRHVAAGPILERYRIVLRRLLAA
jgi:formiminoglutamate deiminase